MAFDRASISSTFKPYQPCFCKIQICFPRKFLSGWGCVRHGIGGGRPDSVHVFCIVKHNEQKSIIPEAAKDSAMDRSRVRLPHASITEHFLVGPEIVSGQRCNGLDRGLLLNYYISTSNQRIGITLK